MSVKVASVVESINEMKRAVENMVGTRCEFNQRYNDYLKNNIFLAASHATGNIRDAK